MQPSIKSTTEQGDQSRPLSHTHKISKIHQKAKPLENKPISHNPIKKFSHYSHIFKNKPTQHEIKEFMATWSRLTPDKYLNNPKNRSRKVAKFTYSALDCIITPIKDTTFYQSKEVNKILGGVNRVYEKSEETFIQSPITEDILIRNCQRICRINAHKKWLITCHQIRIHCNNGEAGEPTPEGLHCDGHSYVFQHFIQKHSISGGQSRICSKNGVTLKIITLNKFLETIFLNDQELLHDVSPIFLLPKSDLAGFRDMLIIDFDPIET